MGSDEPSVFWRNLILVAVFFTLTPITIVASLVSLFSITPPATSITKKIAQAPSNVGAKVYASLPSSIPSISGFATATDARPEIVKQYLSYYGSPLVAYAKDIVDTADKYGIDYRFIPAIAQQESNLCKIIPPGSYNCWGWGITSVSSLGFDSYEDGIDTVTKGLKQNYIDEGYITPQEIMTKYTPSSNGSWARGVSQFMSEMQ